MLLLRHRDFAPALARPEHVSVLWPRLDLARLKGRPGSIKVLKSLGRLSSVLATGFEDFRLECGTQVYVLKAPWNAAERIIQSTFLNSILQFRCSGSASLVVYPRLPRQTQLACKLG